MSLSLRARFVLWLSEGAVGRGCRWSAGPVAQFLNRIPIDLQRARIRATVDQEDGTGHVAARVTTEKQRRPNEFSWLRPAVERRKIGELLAFARR